MPMIRDEHENLLNELLTPDLEHSRRTEILQTLRVDYSTVIGDHESLTKDKEKLQKDNSDLVVSNSKLFRQIGLTETGKEEEKKQSVSETITIDQFEKE